eukprot:1750606-Amphidinium_carterae.1
MQELEGKIQELHLKGYVRKIRVQSCGMGVDVLGCSQGMRHHNPCHHAMGIAKVKAKKAKHVQKGNKKEEKDKKSTSQVLRTLGHFGCGKEPNKKHDAQTGRNRASTRSTGSTIEPTPRR